MCLGEARWAPHTLFRPHAPKKERGGCEGEVEGKEIWAAGPREEKGSRGIKENGFTGIGMAPGGERGP